MSEPWFWTHPAYLELRRPIRKSARMEIKIPGAEGRGLFPARSRPWRGASPKKPELPAINKVVDLVNALSLKGR